MDIADWRRKIDDIDKQLLQLLNQRAHCALEIGKLKKAQDIPILSTIREDEIIRGLIQNNHGPFEEQEIHIIFSTIIEECRKIQLRHYQ